MRTRLALALFMAATGWAALASDPQPAYPVVTPGAKFRFPRDHGAHSAYRTVWWYLTGWLDAPDGRPIGFQITFFALVGLESQKEAVLSAFEALVTAWPEVRECHMIRGGGDFLLRLVARDTAHENALTARLTGAAQVARVQTLQTIRTSRDEPGVPVPGVGG